MHTLFDAYLMVDWSASKERNMGSDSIWFALLERTCGARLSLQAVLENPATRYCARVRLGEVLGDLKKRGKRVLAGFDFPFGYPHGTALALGLPSGRSAWREMWREIDCLVSDGPDNSNNRFSVADQLNQRVPGDGPFWGKPSWPKYHQFGHLGTGAPPDPTHGLAKRRLCEQLVPRAQSVWQLNGVGSVGGQTLTGLPVLRALHADARLEGHGRVWPFEMGLKSIESVSPDEGSIVFAEIYPSLLEQEFTPLIIQYSGGVKDASQVLAIALHFATLDDEGALGEAFKGDSKLAPPKREYVEREEGWILGITGKDRLPLRRELPPMVLEHDPGSKSALVQVLQKASSS